MQIVDYLIIGLVAVSVLVGYFRGLIYEAMSIATWLAAIWLAWRFGGGASPLVASLFDSPAVQQWLGRAIIFLLVLVIGGLAAWLISMVVKKTGLSGTDRTLGMVFGFVRGALIVGLLVIVGEALGFSQDPWWQDSKFIPYGERVAVVVSEWAAIGADYIETIDAEEWPV